VAVTLKDNNYYPKSFRPKRSFVKSIPGRLVGGFASLIATLNRRRLGHPVNREWRWSFNLKEGCSQDQQQNVIKHTPPKIRF
jgi:hypothetical protein